MVALVGDALVCWLAGRQAVSPWAWMDMVGHASKQASDSSRNLWALPRGAIMVFGAGSLGGHGRWMEPLCTARSTVAS